ncbi:MAG: hypothetical protein FGM33_09420 [Candidatus Kapabacteria bacterium]|nr:hypothetical protein [Candidatus Kapabacteria bacterium]
MHRLQLIHPGQPVGGITLQPGSPVPTYSLSLPASAPTSGQALGSNGSGLSWVSGGASFSSITSTGASNTIDNLNNALSWSWSGSSSNIAALMLSTNLINKSIPTATTLRLALTGPNIGALQQTTTLDIVNSRTGTGSINYGVKINGSEVLGGSNTSEDQPALMVVNGLTGFGTTMPSAIVHIGSGTNTANAGAPLKLHNGRANVSLDTYTGTNDYKAGEMAYWDTVFVSSVANDMMGTMPSIMYRCLNDSLANNQSVTNYNPTTGVWYDLFRAASGLPTITLPRGTYEFEILFLLNYSGYIGFRFLEGGTPTVEYAWMTLAYDGGTSSGNDAKDVSFNVTSSNDRIEGPNATANDQVFIRGIIRVTSATADLTPQLRPSSSAATDIHRNAYMKISCLGADNVKRRGKWE